MSRENKKKRLIDKDAFIGHLTTKYCNPCNEKWPGFECRENCEVKVMIDEVEKFEGEK